MTYFDSLSIDDIREMVDPDRPELMMRQADRWAAISYFYTDQAALLNDNLTAIRPSWTGSAAERFYFEVEQVVGNLQLAAEVADGNATGWQSISEYVRYARAEIVALHDEWLLVKAELGGEDDQATLEARRTYDATARSIMTFTADEATDIYLRELWHPEPIGPDGDDFHHAEYVQRSTVITEQRADAPTLENGRENKPDPKSRAESKAEVDRNMIDGHGPREDGGLIEGHGPESDEFVSILNGPQYNDGAPGSPLFQEEPVLQNPATTLAVALPTAPTIPSNPALPAFSGQPVTPPVAFGPPAGPRRGFTSPPPIARNATAFHTPQQTIRPVIGARPGPSAGVPTVGSASEGLNRPVVGNRPTSVKATAPRRLIDGKGIIRSGNRIPVRGPLVSRSSNRPLPRGAILPQPRRDRAVPIAEEVRNLKRRHSRPEPDVFEPETPTVPGIIDGPRSFPAADPGPVLNRQPTTTDDCDERATVARLSVRPEPQSTNQDLWSPTTTVSPGVIGSRRHDAVLRDAGTAFPR